MLCLTRHGAAALGGETSTSRDAIFQAAAFGPKNSAIPPAAEARVVPGKAHYASPLIGVFVS